MTLADLQRLERAKLERRNQQRQRALGKKLKAGKVGVVLLCFDCANTRETYEMGLKVGKSLWWRMKIQIFREVENNTVQYLNAAGHWTTNRNAAVLFNTLQEAKQFAADNGEDISASFAVANLAARE